MSKEYQKAIQEKTSVFYELLEQFCNANGITDDIENWTSQGWNEERFKLELVNMFNLHKAINKEIRNETIALKETQLKHLQDEINELKERFNPK